MFETELPVASDFILMRSAWSLEKCILSGCSQSADCALVLVNDIVVGNSDSGDSNIG